MWPLALRRAAEAAVAAEWPRSCCQRLLSLGGLATLPQARQGKIECTQGISDGFFFHSKHNASSMSRGTTLTPKESYDRHKHAGTLVGEGRRSI